MRFFLILLGVCAAAAAASAHAFLDHAVPAVGATVPTAPPVLRLYFSERVEPVFSGAELATSAGNPIQTGAATLDPQNPAALVVRLPPLQPGRYRVRWHVVSVDTHRTEGSFEFEIRQ